MKSVLILLLALSTSLSPAVVQAAQPGREQREDRQERRENRQALKADQRDACRDGVVTQQEQRELARDRADVRESLRELRYDRSRQETWRERTEWKSYRGQRSGYWFAPGYGYQTSVRGRTWRRGAYVPRAYRRFYVQEPHYYGLPQAPRGQRWIYADGNFVRLIVATGLIASVVVNGY
jgi:Ni/Co efflux regulator RcnB